MPKRTLSKELDLDGNGTANGAAKPTPRVIQSLEAQAEAMF